MTTLSTPPANQARSPALDVAPLFDGFGVRAVGRVTKADAGALRKAIQEHGVVFLPAEAIPAGGPDSLLGDAAAAPEPLLATAGRWHFTGGFGTPAPAFAFALSDRAGMVLDFSDARLAYESLDPALRAYADTLSAIRYIDSTGALADAVPDTAARAAILERHPATAASLVRRHAASGRSYLAADETFTNYVRKTERIFSHNLLGILFDHLRAPAVTGTLVLREGEAALWDSNVIQVRHAATARIVHFKEGTTA